MMNKTHILLIKDNNIFAEEIISLLNELGYSVTVTSFGEEAIKLICQLPPQLILLGIKLRGAMDGIQVAHKIRTSYQIPFLFLTSCADKETIDRAKKAEPYGYLIKPVKKDILYGAIETALHKALLEKRIRENETRYRSIFSTAASLILILNSDGTIVEVNNRVQDMLGYLPDEIIGKDITKFIHPDYLSTAWSMLKGILTKGISLNHECCLVHKDGSFVDVSVNASGLKDDEDQFIQSLCIVSDITEQKHSERLIQHLNKVLTTIRKVDQLIIRETDKHKLLQHICQLLTENQGYFNAWMARHKSNDSFELFASSGLSKKSRQLADQLKKRELPRCIEHASNGKNLIVTMDTYKVCVNCILSEEYQGKAGFAKRLEYKNKFYGVLVVSIPREFATDSEERSLFEEVADDIAHALYSIEIEGQKKRIEQKLINTLKEKTVLLHEIHHRVRNILQVVYSLLRLQVSRIEDDRAKQILIESRDRVRAMALIHEKLYQTKNFAKIDMRSYINKLTTELLHTYHLASQKIILKTDIDEVYFELDMAIPFGLLINELITNSLKYAFQKKKNGMINIVLKEKKDSYELKVSDDGIGLPAHIDVRKPNTLGLELVNALTKQLGGALNLQAEKGTTYTISFPKFY